jgi:hypothetical protein
MALNVTYAPCSGATTPVFPVYNDNTHLFTASTLNRNGFICLSDVYINDNFAGRLKNYPFDNVLQLNPQKLAASNISHDFNYNVNRIIDNPNSIKKLYFDTRESYSRALSFSSITSASTYVQLNLVSGHNLQVNDRVYIQKDDITINPEYNTYAKVLTANTNSLVVDLPYQFTQAIETGIVWEGVEYFDYSYINGELTITTTNPHNFNAGDTIYLQMDTWAVGIIKLTGGTSGTISSVLLNGIDLLGSPAVPVPFNTSLAQTAADLAAAINSTTTTPNYTAYNFAGDDRVFIYSTRQAGTASVGYPLNVSSTGTLSGTFSPALFNTTQVDANTNTGWNPHYTGTYPIIKVTGPNTFTVNIPGPYLSNPPGSERGSIYSPDNWINPTGFTGDTYYIMNNANQYDFIDYITAIDNYKTDDASSRFLTNGPKKNKFYTVYDFNSKDILYDVTTTKPLKNIILKTFSGGTTFTTYDISVEAFVTAFTSSTNTYHRFSIGMGPANLNSIDPSFIFPAATQPLINDSVTKYEIYLSSGDTMYFPPFNPAPAISETLTFVKECNKFLALQIMWLNRFGSYDYFTLDANFNLRRAFEKIEYQKKAQKVYSPTEYGVKPTNKGFSVLSNDETSLYVLNTNWLTEDEADWLEELFTSTDVYLYHPSSDLDIYNLSIFPVTIIDTEVSFFNERSRMRKYEINVKIGTKKIIQNNQ